MTIPEGHNPRSDAEFSIDALLEPSEETRGRFTATFEQLGIAHESWNRAVGVGIADDHGGIAGNVDVSYTTYSTMSPSPHIGLTVTMNGENTFITTDRLQDKSSSEANVYRTFKAWLESQDDADEATKWMKEAVRELETDDKRLRTIAVGHLLDTAPTEPGEYSHGFLIQKFRDGTDLQASHTKANDAWIEGVKEDPAAAGIEQTSIRFTQSGIKYDYSRYLDGREELTIKDPKQSVKREVADSDDITMSFPTGLSLQISGTPEAMRETHAALQEDAEERRLGLKQVTDGKMKAFTAALQAAIESGIAPEPPKGVLGSIVDIN